jgi:hypothetical protein
VAADTLARHPLNDGLVALLNDTIPPTQGQDERFGLGRAPEQVPLDDQGRLIDGYGIVYPLLSPLLWGSLSRPERALTASYQVTYVGRSPEHAQRLADEGHAVLTGRADGGWVHGIDAPGVAVLGRRCRERGSVEQATGGLWQVADIYDMEAQADG